MALSDIDKYPLYIDSTNSRVGIGTSSPSDALTVSTSAVNGGVTVSGSTDPQYFLNSSGGNQARFKINDASSMIQTGSWTNIPVGFYTNGTERMRITSAGDVAMLNHASIGVNAPASTRALTVAGATDGSGSSILVCYNSSLAQKFAVRDDGYITATGDIQVGGGVLLGGTGSANKLDDYEEGTWTATHGGNNMTIDNGNPSYVKIGRLVTVCADVTSVAGSSTTNTIGGLPFAPVYPHGTADVSYVTGSSGAAGGYVSTTPYAINFIQNGGTSGANISAGDRIIFKAIYYTDA